MLELIFLYGDYRMSHSHYDLHRFIEVNNIEVVKKLINEGVDVNGTLVSEWTPLHTAAYENRSEIIEILLELDEVDANARTIALLIIVQKSYKKEESTA